LVVKARTPNALNEMFLTLEKEALYAGLIVNQSKTKYVKTARGEHKITQQYIIEQNQFERVNEFTCFGTQINAQNKRIEEIRKRIQAGNRCYYANKNLLSNKLLNYNSKIQIYKTIIRSTVTYGCETWALTASDEN
jgi:anti-sigma28 factor (negative regulator of flagellin synthesis)